MTLPGHWPLGETDIFQHTAGNTGTGTPTSITVTLPNNVVTSPARALILFVATTSTVTTPTNWALIGSATTTGLNSYCLTANTAVVNGNSWSVSLGGAASAAWAVLETTAVQTTVGNDSPAVASGGGNVSASTFGPTVEPRTPDVMVLGFWAGLGTSGTQLTWNDHTNLLQPLDETSTTKAAGSNVGVSLARRFPGTTTSTLYQATASATTAVNALVVTFVGFPYQPTFEAQTGFEQQTIAGAATGNAGNRMFDAATNTAAMSIVTGRGGSGTSALRVNRNAAASLTWTTSTLGTPETLVKRLYGKVDAATGTPAIAGNTTAAGVSLVVSYVEATNKIRLQVGAGTAVDSVEAVALGAWFRLDYRYSVNLTQYTGEWCLNGITQTTALSQTGLTATTVDADFPVGWSDTATIDATYDDIAVSAIAADYPIGDGREVLLTVDPAAAPTVNGTVGNFALVTSNATGATLTAGTVTNARDAVDEVPPTIGATADGVCQINAAAGDYLQFPLTTYTLGGLEVYNCLRFLAPGWAAGTQAATLTFKANTTPTHAPGGGSGANQTTTFDTAADPNFDNSTTTPAWVCVAYPVQVMGSGTWGYDQGVLDTMAVQVGFSTDATPDVGVHALYMATDVRRSLRLEPVNGTPPDIYMIRAYDTLTDGTALLEITTPAAYGAVVTYTRAAGGGPVEVTVPAATTLQHNVGVDAPLLSSISLRPN